MRFFLYFVLILFSMVLFGLTAARLYYTTHLEPDDPLNNGASFYDPVVVELLGTSALIIFITPFFAMTIRRGYQTARATRIWFEILILFILWMLLFVGAAIATSIWPDLSWCDQYNACRVIQAMLAFAWLTWIVLTILMISMVIFAVTYRAWGDHIHSFRWRRTREAF